MTLLNERTNAIQNVREFLRALLDPKKTPRVPRSVRIEAWYMLKHFPSAFDMESPENFEWPNKVIKKR